MPIEREFGLVGYRLGCGGSQAKSYVESRNKRPEAPAEGHYESVKLVPHSTIQFSIIKSINHINIEIKLKISSVFLLTRSSTLSLTSSASPKSPTTCTWDKPFAANHYCKDCVPSGAIGHSRQGRYCGAYILRRLRIASFISCGSRYFVASRFLIRSTISCR